jgi:histidine triad (HIT) family protein
VASLDCHFCEIIRREDPDAREVYRDGKVVAFFPQEPATLGHILVAPREHIRDIWSLDAATAGQIGEVTLKLAAAVKRVMQPEGLNLIQSNGKAATQTVMHLLVHIVPRWEGDAIGRIWPPDTRYSEAQKDEAWEALRAACRSL